MAIHVGLPFDVVRPIVCRCCAAIGTTYSDHPRALQRIMSSGDLTN